MVACRMCVGLGKPRPVETKPDAPRFDSGRRRMGSGLQGYACRVSSLRVAEGGGFPLVRARHHVSPAT